MIDVGFGSRQATMTLDASARAARTALRGDRLDRHRHVRPAARQQRPGRLPHRRRRAAGAVNFVGPGDGAPGGSAMINATFYGVDEAAPGRPESPACC